MSTPDNTSSAPADNDNIAEAAPGSGTPAVAFDFKAKNSWIKRLPIVSHLRQSVGLQRGMLITGLILCGIVGICAIFAPLIAPYGFNQLGTSAGNFGSKLPPGGTHIWGTTVGGYDVFSRVVWGAQTAVSVIIVAVLMSIFAGVILGLVSGYLGGWLDRILVVIADAVYAFPTLLLALVMSIAISGGQSSAWGGIAAAAFSITVVFIPQYFRVVRAETLRLKAEPFVESAIVLGASKTRIISKHIFRNATRTLPLIFTLNSSEAILTLAGLGFLGFGIEPTSASEWGYDLNKALPDVTSGVWWTSVFPGAAIVLTVLGITLVGESMNDLNDPRLRVRRKAKTKAAKSAKATTTASAATAGTRTAGTRTAGTGSAGVSNARTGTTGEAK